MKTYTVEEIEEYLELGKTLGMESVKGYVIIRQLLAERAQIRRQAFEEAAEIAKSYRTVYRSPHCDLYIRELQRKEGGYIAATLRRKAEEG